ncbi:MAG: 30S ribosomal protein S12 [Candidatus Aenigmarchaeota archaeon]|nr:30S ribosomal protein S12 [Candidatus Aenigmarchaeota archaeon]
MGTFNVRKLMDKRKKARWKKRDYRVRMLHLEKKISPLEGAPQGKGLVLSKRQIEQKQPHSGMIKCVRIKLIKNGKEVTAHAPKDKAITFIQEHDEVTIEEIGGSQGKSYGSLSGVRYRVCAVNGISLEMLRKGKKQRATR